MAFRAKYEFPITANFSCVQKSVPWEFVRIAECVRVLPKRAGHSNRLWHRGPRMAVSCEPGRKKAHSPDLQWQVVYQMNVSFERIGQNLGIARSTGHRIYALFEQTGTVDPRSH